MLIDWACPLYMIADPVNLICCKVELPDSWTNWWIDVERIWSLKVCLLPNCERVLCQIVWNWPGGYSQVMPAEALESVPERISLPAAALHVCFLDSLTTQAAILRCSADLWNRAQIPRALTGVVCPVRGHHGYTENSNNHCSSRPRIAHNSCTKRTLYATVSFSLLWHRPSISS